MARLAGKVVKRGDNGLIVDRGGLEQVAVSEEDWSVADVSVNRHTTEGGGLVLDRQDI